MIVVSDTSPLNYLILVDCIDVLPQLFQEVFAPTAVLDELRHLKAPDKVRHWADQPPHWLRVQGPQRYTPIQNLHQGENEAIALALEIQADNLLVDERDATRIAERLGIRVVGTLAVLGAAAKASLIDLETVMELLRQTNFRGPVDLMDEMIEQDRLRRNDKSR